MGKEWFKGEKKNIYKRDGNGMKVNQSKDTIRGQSKQVNKPEKTFARAQL